MRYPENSPHVHKVVGDFLDTKYVPFTVGTNPSLYHTTELKQMDKLCPLIFYEEQLATDWAVYAYTLQNLFENKKIKYYMFNTCHGIPVTEENKDIIESLNTDLYYTPDDIDHSMLYWALNKGFEKTDCWHLKADGHVAWSEHLETLIQKQGLLDNIKPVFVENTSNAINVDGISVTANDLQSILQKYKIQARVVLDSMYDKIYILYPDSDTDQIMKIKTNMINRDLAKRLKTNVRVDKFDNVFAEMDDTFIVDYFRKQNST
jgi:lysophospholipase L1-like esterase